MLIGFIVWALVGAAIIALGIYDYHAQSTRPFGFWSNVKAGVYVGGRGFCEYCCDGGVCDGD